MEQITLTLHCRYSDGKVEVKTFKIGDQKTLKDILDKLQDCKLSTKYVIYPDKK